MQNNKRYTQKELEVIELLEKTMMNCKEISILSGYDYQKVSALGRDFRSQEKRKKIQKMMFDKHKQTREKEKQASAVSLAPSSPPTDGGGPDSPNGFDTIDILLNTNKSHSTDKKYRGFYFETDILSVIDGIDRNKKSALVNECMRKVLKEKGVIR